jgi:chemotaxis response regulator CheB
MGIRRERVRPGHVYLCPGRTLVRLEPDGTLTVQEFPRLSSRGLIDELFVSAVTALGPALQ